MKLGSLYNCNKAGGGGSLNGGGSLSSSRYDLLAQENARELQRDRLEFNQRVQEQRLLAEERRDWERLSPDHGQLQVSGFLIVIMEEGFFFFFHFDFCTKKYAFEL